MTNLDKRIDKLAQKYKNKRVIIYGTGKLLDIIRKNNNLSKFNIIGISDIKFKDGEEFMGYKTIAPESISVHNPDVVLISVVEVKKVTNFLENIIIPEFGKFKYDSFISTGYKIL
ncbi:MAG TPA: hypothetical protein P5556_03435 [Candidatus Gastranaerophilales bacterium]|nr:hypothetical protein [Candidatus Gastranaerophilales bacterium]